MKVSLNVNRMKKSCKRKKVKWANDKIYLIDKISSHFIKFEFKGTSGTNNEFMNNKSIKRFCDNKFS